jgi:hypothetical protein
MEDEEEDETQPHVPNIIRNEDSRDYVYLRPSHAIYEERKLGENQAVEKNPKKRARDS